MVVLNEKALDEILGYLERSILNLSEQASVNSEFASGFEDFEVFISSQFDIRLESLLKAKNSSIHHLESKMKNTVIQKKAKILEKIKSKKGF